MSETIAQRLASVTANSLDPVIVLAGDGVTDSTCWAEVYEGAQQRAASLQALEVGSGDRVAVLGFTSLPAIEALLGILMAGATIVVLPLPMRLGSRDAFIEATRNRIAVSGAKLLLVDEFFASQYEPHADDPPIVRIEDLGGARHVFEEVDVDPSDLAVLQFTSGSTAAPRAVLLSHRAICNNIWSIDDALESQGDETVVSWLPLYHDMGLIGTLLTPATIPYSLVVSPAQAFLSRPAMWMEAVSSFGATITCAPNFGYALANRALRRAGDLDLSRLRAALCGAEPVSMETMNQFIEAGRPFGLRETAPLPVYGLAEATLAVTFPKPTAEFRVDVVNRTQLEDDDLAGPVGPSDSGGVKNVVGLGRPLRGISLRIIDSEGDLCPERHVGEVVVATDAAMDGYDNHPDETAAVLRNGWLHTGDLGYLVDGELFICGRKKDLIIVGGRNIWPEDVEEIAQQVPGVRAGNAIAFSVHRSEEREGLVLVAETRQDPLAASETASTVARSVRKGIGLAPREVLLLEPGELPKTSSGKLQRGLCRQQYLEGHIEPVAAHGIGN